MNAQQLLKPDQSPSGVYICGECCITHESEYWAQQCCSRSPLTCLDCPVVVPRYRMRCAPCDHRRDVAQESARWAKAWPVDIAAPLEGLVYACDESGHPVGYRYGYFDDLDAFEEWLVETYESRKRDGDCPWHPALHLYPTNRAGMVLDASDMIQRALEDHHEDAGDELGPEDHAELQAALDAWLEKHNVFTYDPDYERKLVIWPDLSGEACASSAPSGGSQ